VVISERDISDISDLNERKNLHMCIEQTGRYIVLDVRDLSPQVLTLGKRSLATNTREL